MRGKAVSGADCVAARMESSGRVVPLLSEQAMPQESLWASSRKLSRHHQCTVRFCSHSLLTYRPRSQKAIQEQIHRLRGKQLPIRVWRPNVISPGEFNLKSSASSIVTHATDLNVLHRLALDRQWLDTVRAVAEPIPAPGAPMEVTVEIAGHQDLSPLFCSL